MPLHQLKLTYILLLLLSVLPLIARCNTDEPDGNVSAAIDTYTVIASIAASALQELYRSLNSPSQLTNWQPNSGDPCGESWKGITCDGSSVISLEVPGLGLTGTMGYLLSNVKNMKTIDLSNNNIRDGISYQLPPSLVTLNVAENNFTGNFPYSLSTMNSLVYLNASHNKLSSQIPDFFSGLTNLSTLDISFNNFSGSLPRSFTTLSNLEDLDLQSNSLNGSIDGIKTLPLTTLNVANNNFSGLIPQELLSIPHFTGDGNSFENNPMSLSPSPPSPRRSPSSTPSHHRYSPPAKSSRRLTLTAIIGICFGVLILCLLLLLLFVFFVKNNRKKQIPMFPRTLSSASYNGRNMAAVTDLKPLQTQKPDEDSLLISSTSVKRTKPPISATSYTVAALQVATSSFSQDNLIGEGTLGRVYKAEFPNGKIMAIKKIDNATLPLQEDDDVFLDAVSAISSLRHPNIVSLVGFCSEYKQHLLVYEFFGKGNLHDMLHYDDGTVSLSWNTRVKVALGTARALEYLHEVCAPPVVHRNLKSANILLDYELNPHLSDSGLASLTTNPERQVTTRMVGSFGYSAPEYGLSGVYTIKSDVYSFGVVMLELLTGRKPLDSSRVRSEQSLVRWATPQLHDIDALAKMVDPALNGMYPVKSLSRFADIIALCVQPEPEFRPPMSEVVQALVRLVQRASAVRRSNDELGMSYRTPEHEAVEMSF